MTFDLGLAHRLIDRYGRVCRVCVLQTRGSAPRDAGTDMWITPDGQIGTIGGGQLEYSACDTARAAITTQIDSDRTRWTNAHALGPDMGQCCGGHVILGYEILDAASLPSADQDLFIRSFDAHQDVNQDTQTSRAHYVAHGQTVGFLFRDGMVIDALQRAAQPLWIWGAGHVGRAMVDILSPLPEFDITWVDTDPSRFPADIPDTVDILYAPQCHDLAKHAPQQANHLILTYSHHLDLMICDAVLRRSFHWAGLIGSDTKWARFRNRLAHLGHEAAQIQRITCPIGRRDFGKHPFAIAIGMANCLLEMETAHHLGKEKTA